MRMKQLSLIMHIICVSVVLGYVSSAAKHLFVLSPPSLHLKPGENATFTCNISTLNHNPKDINWYIITGTKNAPEKIADIKDAKDERMNSSINWTLREAKLYIINVTFNDSGKYYCNHLNMTSSVIISSNISELFVNDVPRTVTNETEEYLPESNSSSLEMSIISISLILTLLLLIAIGSAIFLFCYKRRNNIPQQQDLEKPPQDSSVYTVDYGILEFGDSQPYRKSPDLSVLEQVEYATITFPQQTPIMGEKRRKLA